VNPASRCFSANAFAPPIKKIDKATPEKIKSRIQLNFAFFLSNYALLLSSVSITVALMHPGMLLFVALVWGLWSFHSFLIRHELEFFGLHVHSLLSIQQRFYVLLTITVLVVIIKCLWPAVMISAISSLLILSHAFLRDPKSIDTTGGLLRNDNDDEEGGDDKDSEKAVLVERP
jgi:hypothetical protein